jgi:MFS family permease
MANRQIAGSIASIISGGVAGYVLNSFEAPQSYAYLFMVSSLFMIVGFGTFVTIDEPSKENISTKEKDFKSFIKNAIKLLKKDKRLQRQILAIFLSFSYLISMPFVILKASSSFELTGWALGGFITIQMLGSILGSSLLWRRISDYEKMLSLAFIFMIIAFVTAIFADTIYGYALIFLFLGIGLDGFSNSSMNLVIEIAPEDKRPIYTAIQTNLVSIGLFFPILGGIILKLINNYTIIYGLSILLLLIGLWVSLKLKNEQ